MKKIPLILRSNIFGTSAVAFIFSYSSGLLSDNPLRSRSGMNLYCVRLTNAKMLDINRNYGFEGAEL